MTIINSNRDIAGGIHLLGLVFSCAIIILYLFSFGSKPSGHIAHKEKMF
jgi:hypothetical protein